MSYVNPFTEILRWLGMGIAFLVIFFSFN